MKRKGIFALLVSLSAVGVMVFGLSSPAVAGGDDDAIACVFQGSTNNLDDILPVGNAGGHGTYDFSTSGAGVKCVVVDNDNDASGENETGVWDGSITSTGSYQNQQCGTGHAHGHPWLDVSPNNGGEGHPPSQAPFHAADITHPSSTLLTAVAPIAAPGDTDGVTVDSPVNVTNYEADFREGEGNLLILEAIDGDGDTVSQSTLGQGYGHVSIIPKPNPTNPVGHPHVACVTERAFDFDVVGTFIAETGSP